MAGKPLIFESLTITSNDNASNTVTIPLTDDENITIGNEPIEVLVEGGNTIPNAYNRELSIISYDTGVVASNTSPNVTTYIQTNVEIPAFKADIVLNGRGTGSTNVSIDNVRVKASRPFNDGLTRDHILIKATIRATTAISVT